MQEIQILIQALYNKYYLDDNPYVSYGNYVPIGELMVQYGY